MDIVATALDTFKALFASLSSDPMGTLTSGNAGDVLGLPIAILVGVGLIQCFFGLKLLRLELLLFGFGGGFFLGNLVAGIEGVGALLTEPWMKYALMGVLGLICTIVAYRFLRLALALGVTAAAYLFLGPILGDMLGSEMMGTVAAIAAGLVIGLIAQKLLKTVVILVTTLIGAFLMAYALSGVLQAQVVHLSYMTVVVLGFFFMVGFTTQVKGIKRR